MKALFMMGLLLASANVTVSGMDQNEAKLFPAVPGSLKRQGVPLHLRFGIRDMAIVTSYSFEPAKDTSRPFSLPEPSSNYWCAVSIRDGTGSVQVVVTVGTGATWYGECGQLKAIGTLPAPTGQARFAVINNVSGPHTEGPYAAFLVRRNGRWAIDEQLADGVGEKVPVTIPALRRFLNRMPTTKR